MGQSPVRRGRRRAPQVILAAAIGFAATAGTASAQALSASLSTTAQSASADASRRGGSTVVGGVVALAGQPRDDLQLNAQVNLHAGDTPDTAMGLLAPVPSLDKPWRKLALNLNAIWDAASLAKLQLEFGQTAEQQSLWTTGAAQGLQTSRNESLAGANLLFDAGKLNFELGGRLAEMRDATASAAGEEIRLRHEQTTGQARAQWTPLQGVTLHVQEKFGYARLFWQGQGDVQQDYVSAEPEVGATVQPWSGGAWTLSLAHAVTPLDTSAFVSVAQTLSEAGLSQRAAGLAPNQQWVAKAQLDQALPIGKLQLALSQARLGSTVETIRMINGVDSPGVITGGQRYQVDLSLAVPLSGVGLSLDAGGRLRRSSIVDPITGAARRLSGEAPYDAHIGLTQTLSGANLRLGVQARAEGASTSYTAQSATAASDARTLGLFVEYHPQAFALRLQVDGLAAGRRDVAQSFYDVSRASDRVVRTERWTDDQPSVSLILRKPL